MSQSAYQNALPLDKLIVLLQQATTTKHHALWHEDISILDAQRFHHAHIHGHRQLTDIYLLGLAVKNKGRFISFDQRIALSAVRSAKPENMVIL